MSGRGGKTYKEEKKAGAPAYIVSYSDIVTNLLAFFILLQVFASHQDPELFNAGRGSFIRALDGFGIPGLIFGSEQRIDMEGDSPAYIVDGPESGGETVHTKDAEAQRIAELLERINESFKAEAVGEGRGTPVVLATSLRFRRGEAVLDERGEAYLRGLWEDLLSFGRGGEVEVEIRGYAEDEGSSSRKWAVAAARASAAERCLEGMREKSGGERSWVIRSSGSGAPLPGAQKDLSIVIHITEG